jgi:hypothetical protein
MLPLGASQSSFSAPVHTTCSPLIAAAVPLLISALAVNLKLLKSGMIMSRLAVPEVASNELVMLLCSLQFACLSYSNVSLAPKSPSSQLVDTPSEDTREMADPKLIQMTGHIAISQSRPSAPSRWVASRFYSQLEQHVAHLRDCET